MTGPCVDRQANDLSVALPFSGEAALVDGPKGHLNPHQRAYSANSKSQCKFKAKAHRRLKTKARHEKSAKCAAKPVGVELDAWGFPISSEPKFSSRQRMRQRKLGAERALDGMKPRNADGAPKARSFTVCICGKFSRNDKGGDLIIEAKASSKTAVRNAQFCGSASTCPDCAQHIGITRGTYVEKAIDALRVAGYRIVMGTMTVPHKVEESCTDVVDRLKAAHSKFDAHGTVRAIRAKYGYVGRIRSNETNYGDSGWHPHSHDIDVYEGPGCETTAAEDNDWCAALEGELFATWDKIIVSLTGRHASKTHGMTIVPVWSSTDYTVKLPEQAKKREESGKPRWGVQAEVTKSHVKKAENGGRTPWELLDGCYKGNPTDIALFQSYAQAWWGRTLFETTKRLRDLLETLGVTIGTDLEIIREEPDYVFSDEAHENDGDQSQILVDRILIDRDSQSAAHMDDPHWLEQVRHDVELELAIDLPHAMRSLGFTLELVKASTFVGARVRQGLPRSAYFDPNRSYVEPAHFEPNVWRAIYKARDWVSQ